MPLDEKSLEDNRPEILKELDSFNTAKEFGLMGILAEQEQAKELPEEQPAKEEKKPEPEIDYTKAYAPLNTSIQELGYQSNNRLDALERSLHELKNGLTSAQAQRQETFQPPPNYDPEAPVTMREYMEQQTKLRQIEQAFTQRSEQFALDQARLNAHLTLAEYKRLRPDFNITQQELDRAFYNAASRNKQDVLNVNWAAQFDQYYNQTVLPKKVADFESAQKKIQALEDEIKTLKKKTPEAAAPLSPATRTTSRAIQSPAQAGDLDVNNLRSFRRQGHWKEFSRDIKNHHGIA
jgi:hypothetical protein